MANQQRSTGIFDTMEGLMTTPAEDMGLGSIKNALGGNRENPRKMPLGKSPQNPPPVSSTRTGTPQQQHMSSSSSSKGTIGSFSARRLFDGGDDASSGPAPSESSTSSSSSEASMDVALVEVHQSMRFMSLVFMAHMFASLAHIACFAAATDEGRQPLDAIVSSWPHYGLASDVSWMAWTKAFVMAVLACVKPHQPYATDAINSAFFAVYLFRGSKDFQSAIEATYGDNDDDGDDERHGLVAARDAKDATRGPDRRHRRRDKLLTDGLWELVKIFRKMRIPKLLVTLKIAFAAAVPVWAVVQRTSSHYLNELTYHYGACLFEYQIEI